MRKYCIKAIAMFLAFLMAFGMITVPVSASDTFATRIEFSQYDESLELTEIPDFYVVLFIVWFEVDGDYLCILCYNPWHLIGLSPDPFFHALHGNLQSCPIQAGNLYVFVGNNPVMFIDPSGLVRVNTQEYALAQGATITNLSPASDGRERIRISYGGQSMTVTVNSGYMQDSVLNERFGWTNPFISAGQTQALHMSSHNVVGTNQHIAIVMFSEHGGPLTTGSYGRYFTNRHFGMLYATIGGGGAPGTGRRLNQELTAISGPPTAGLRLYGGINRSSDVNLATKGFWHNFNVHDASTINSLFTLTNNFNANVGRTVAYGAVPRANSRYFNSSSFSHGLLLAAGVSVPNLSGSVTVPWGGSLSFPGWSKPLPRHVFATP